LEAINRCVHVKRLVAPVAVAVLTVIAGVTAGVLSQSAASGQSARQPLAVTATTIPSKSLGLLPASPQLSTRIVLSRTHVVAGSLIKGFVVVTNRGKPLRLWHHSGSLKCTPGYAVALTNDRIPPDIAWYLDCVPRPLLIPSGITRLPFGVMTTFLQCWNTTAEKSVPKCLPGHRTPPLPAGQYKAVLVGFGLRLPAAKAVSVTLTVGVGTASTAAVTSHGSGGLFGHVTGRLVRVGGFPQLNSSSETVGIPGRVVFLLVGTSGSFTSETGPNGGFNVPVPAGFTYRVTGYSPKVMTGDHEELCTAIHRVKVPSRAGSNGSIVVRGVDVLCQIS
jgi:hypothetical protein